MMCWELWVIEKKVYLYETERERVLQGQKSVFKEENKRDKINIKGKGIKSKK